MRRRINVHVITVMKNLNSSKPVPEKGRKLLGTMKLGDMKSITSLRKSGLSERLTPAVCTFRCYPFKKNTA